jgi:hypothetical protein
MRKSQIRALDRSAPMLPLRPGCSWPNMVEIFFGIITRQAIRRGTFRSVKELTTAIGRFIDAYNDRCEPFAWIKDADELLARIRPSRT